MTGTHNVLHRGTQIVEQKRDYWCMDMTPHKDAHLSRKLSKRVEQTWGFIWIHIHVLMYVHTGIKVWHQMKDDWLMHVGPHKGMFVGKY